MTNSLTVVDKVFSIILIFLLQKCALLSYTVLTFFQQENINVIFALFQDRNFNITLANNFVKF